MTFHIGVVGSRSIVERDKFLHALAQAPWLPNNAQTLTPTDIDLEVVTGGADGIDSMAENWALEQGFDVTIHKPNWSDWSNGHPALARNTDIVEGSDAVLAVWDGQSNGTRDSIDKALDRGVPLYVEVVDDG